MYTLSDGEYRSLKNCYIHYRSLYPCITDANCLVSRACWKTKIIHICKDIFGSIGSRSNRSAYITAYWCGENGLIQQYDSMYFAARPGRILYFVMHNLFIDDVAHPHIFAFTEWYLPMGDVNKYKYGKNVEVWSSDLFEPLGSASFMPIQRIKSKFLHIKFELDCKNVMAVIPRKRATCF